MIDHPHAITVWPTIRFDKGTMEQVLVIETDLAISQDHPDFDADAFNGLVEAGRDFLEKNPNNDSVRVEPISRVKTS